MFHPPKIPQRQWNGNRTGLQWVPIANPLNANMGPVVDPFPPVVGRCWPNGHCWKCNGVINLLNYNGFATGGLLQPVGHPLHRQRAPFLMTNGVERLILAVGNGYNG